MARASDLELCLCVPLSDLHQLSVTSTCLLKEVTDISNLLRHDGIFICESKKALRHKKMKKLRIQRVLKEWRHVKHRSRQTDAITEQSRSYFSES